MLQTGKLDEARRDYEKLAGKYPDRHIFQYGLGEVADRKQEVAATVRHFTRYLELAPKGTTEYTNVLARVAELTKGK